MSHMRQSIGVRELRRDLSEYLSRVEEGESFAVTSRGREVALLVPAPGRADAIRRLVADRDAVAPRVDLLEVEPLQLEGGPPLSALLDDVRADR
jgi:prevent-host-death family protein